MNDTLTRDEVIEAQSKWGAGVVAADPEALLALYDFSELVFKPTMSASIRTDAAGARSYFVGGDVNYPGDKGFLHNGFVAVDFDSARGPVIARDGLTAHDMGHYTFTQPDGTEVFADYSFAYRKVDGQVRITLHHSSYNVG